jgi:hypothetical protein
MQYNVQCRYTAKLLPGQRFFSLMYRTTHFLSYIYTSLYSEEGILQRLNCTQLEAIGLINRPILPASLHALEVMTRPAICDFVTVCWLRRMIGLIEGNAKSL